MAVIIDGNVFVQAGGANSQVQYNDNGILGGNEGMTFQEGITTLTANNFIATSTANLGAVGNVTITGGSANYVLTTNGSGSLSWTAGGGSGISSIAVQDEGTNVVATANTINFVGNGVTASNVGGVATVSIGGISGITILEDASLVVVTDTLGFTGPLVSVANVPGNIAEATFGLTVKDEGNIITASAAFGGLNFVGAGVTASADSDVANITIPGTSIAIQEEGSNVVASANTINFVGAGVTASNVGGVATVTIPGGGASVGNVSILSSNITLDATYVGGTIIKWANGDFTITAPSTANGVIPVGATINIFNASQTGNVNVVAVSGGLGTVLVGPEPGAPGILSYVETMPFEQLNLVNLGPSAGNVATGSTMWFCYGIPGSTTAPPG